MKISASKVKCYKACKRLYYFKYVEELQSVTPIQVLEDGKSYHALIEEMYNTGGFETTGNPKIDAMATAYLKYIYPQFKVRKVEEWFNYPLNEKHSLIGRYDAEAEDGCIVEHKTTSRDIDDEYIYNLQWDEQILSYMLASCKNEMYYTVCKKPTIRQKQYETEEQFFERCVAWYDDDTEHKIRVIKVTRNEKEIEAHKEALIFIADTIEADNSIVSEEYPFNKEKNVVFYRNPSNCNCYGRRCEFASICLDYDPKLEYVEFKKKEYE